MHLLLKNLLKKDQEATLIWHQIPPHKEISEHAHKDQDEYILIGEGSFDLTIDHKCEHYNIKDGLTILHIPVGARHSLKNGDETIEYFVIRQKKTL